MLKRRLLLSTIAAGTVAWTKPVLQSVVLPLHAQTSTGSNPPSSTMAPSTTPSPPTTLSNWTYTLEAEDGTTIILRHTPGLRRMALTGSVGLLNQEYGNVGYTETFLQRGHESDRNNIDFAPQLHLNGYIIAMYHPVVYPDHFIIYKKSDRSWKRFDLGSGSDESGRPTVDSESS